MPRTCPAPDSGRSSTQTSAEPISVALSPLKDEILVSFASDGPPFLGPLPDNLLQTFTIASDRSLKPNVSVRGTKQCRMVSHPCWIGKRYNYICSGSEDSNILIWTRLGVMVQKLSAHTGPVNQVDSYDGDLIASVSDDARLLLWRASTSAS